MHPRKLIRESLLFATAQYLVRAGLMARGFIAARLLGPEAYGLWNGLLLIMDYGAQSNLGTYQGLDQSVPGRLVDGDPRRIARLKRAGMFNAILLPLLFAVWVIVYLHRTGSQGKLLEFWGLAGISGALVIVLLSAVALVHLSLLRAHDRIMVVSLWFLVQGAIGVGLGVALIFTMGPWGLLWGWLAGTLVATVFVRMRAPGLVPLAPRPARESIDILIIGFPMFVYTASRFVMRSLDRVFILRFIGTLELGYYSLTAMALTLLLYLPDSVVYVLYPHLLKSYHAAGNAPSAIQERVDRALQAVSVLLPLVCGIGFLLTRDLVQWLLPRFTPGIDPVRIVCYGSGGLAISSIAAIVLMTLNRRRYLIPVSLALTGLTALLDYIMVRRGYGIIGIAWATLAVYLLNGLLLYILAMRGFDRPARRIFKGVVCMFTPLVISFVLAYSLDRFVPLGDSGGWIGVLRLLAILIMFKVFYLLAARPFVKGLGLRQLIRELNPRWLGGAASTVTETQDA